MKYSHYRNVDYTIKNEEEGVQLRRFINEENYRLIQFLEGSLTEIRAEDFGDATSLTNDSIFSQTRTQLLYTSFFGATTPFELTTIEIGESIKKIGKNTTDRFFSLSKANQTTPIRIIFPKNLSTIYGRLGDAMSSSSIILDFSKLSSPPTWLYDDKTSSEYGEDAPFEGSILVPSAKLSSWKRETPWSYMADQITGV